MKTHSGKTDTQRLSGLVEIVTATAEVLGQEITASAAEMMANDLEEYQDEQIAGALKACRRELTGRLTLAAIIERIQRVDGHPEPNEAWAIALQASDERRTVVVTEQIQSALRAAQPILDNGDAIGGRMAFIEAYRRTVEAARQSRQSPVWHVSVGWDVEDRADAVTRAVESGRITQDRGEALLLQHRPVAINQDSVSFAVAGLLSGKTTARLSNEESRKRLAELRAVLNENKAKREEAKNQAKQAEVTDLNERRAAVAKALAELPERIRRTV
ncbi:MAG: hypothetical protein RBR22_08140 [Desulfuromonas sp.]|nr:hypothetical protein [Desulfuromonas sp.]